MFSGALAFREKVLDHDKLAEEFNRALEVFSKKHGWQLDAFGLNEYLETAFSECDEQVNTFLVKHDFLLEKAAACMVLLARYVRVGRGNLQRSAFSAQLHRASNNLLASRELLRKGFEETARVVTRSYLESIDISIAIFIDKEFAGRFFEDDANYDQLWKSKIGFGKIYQYIRKAFEHAGFSDSEAHEHIEMRKNLKNLLSSSVHCDESGAFRSLAVSPVGYPDLVSLEPHGVVSYHTANHMHVLVSETYKFLGIIINCIISGKFLHIHDFDKASEEKNLFFTHAIAFQDLVHSHELEDGGSIIAPGHVPEKDWFQKS